MFGYDAEDVFASDALTVGDGTAGTTGSSANDASFTDRLFATGKDFVGQFLDFQAARRLQEEQYKYQLAAKQQQSVLGTTETPQNVGQNPQPIVVQQPGNTQKMNNMLLWAALAVAAVAVIK
jgi:hypothetical protein